MAEVQKISQSVLRGILPTEIVEKILKLLSYKEMCQARLICKRWKCIIKKGNLLKNASGKIIVRK